MADAPAQHPAVPPATVAEVMQPPVTTVEQNDHAAAAAYLMKRAGATALIVTKMPTGQPAGIITEADISRAVADGKNPNDVRIYELMTANPTVVSTTASIRDAAKIMTSKRFRHLPVMGDAGPALASWTSPTYAARCSKPTCPGRPPTPPGRSNPRRTRSGWPLRPRCTSMPRSSSMSMASTAKPIGSASWQTARLETRKPAPASQWRA